MVAPAEKKQVQAVRVSYANLIERISANEMSAEVLHKLTSLIECLTHRNYAGATVVQTVSTAHSRDILIIINLSCNVL